MKDIKFILIFVGLGLALAYVVSAPLRREPTGGPLVGTPLYDQNVYVKGVINVASEAKAKAKGAKALYVIARPAGQAGAPLAVKRIENPSFPVKFSLTTQDHMMSGISFFEGDITITARLDHDGAAGPKQPEDLDGTASIKKGQKRKVAIVVGR